MCTENGARFLLRQRTLAQPQRNHPSPAQLTSNTTEIEPLQRMAAMVKLQRGTGDCEECLLWAVLANGPRLSNLNGFGYGQRIFELNAQISHRAVHLGVPE